MKRIKRFFGKVIPQRSSYLIQERSLLRQLAEDLSEERRYDVFPKHRVTRSRGNQK